MAPITDSMKKREFKWIDAACTAFREIKQKMIEASIMRHPNLSKLFEVAYDASGVGIGGVLSQDG